MGANKENYGSFYSLTFGFPSLLAQKNIPYLQNGAVIVKEQISPDGEEDNSSSQLKKCYSTREAIPP